MRALISLILLSIPLAAQDVDFAVRTRLVLVPVTVTDGNGRFVDGLDGSEFVVLDNGRPQRATADTFGTGVAPIALMVAVQSSGISAPALAKVRRIGGMIQVLVTGERGCSGLVSFDDRVRWLEDCTHDSEALRRAYGALRPSQAAKKGRMLDAVYEATQRLAGRADVRRVLLVISESRDRGSETDLETVVLAAQSAGVTVYTATYSAFKTGLLTKPSDGPLLRPPEPGRAPDVPASRYPPTVPPEAQRLDILGAFGELFRLGKVNAAEVLAGMTGGVAYSFARQRALEEAVQALGVELHSQYVLSFTPELAEPGYHRLEVKITRPGTYTIRARPAYWATQGGS